MKRIISTPYCNLSKDELKVNLLADDLKTRIIKYLYSGELGVAGDCTLKDPFTGEVFSRTSAQRIKDGFEWWSMDTYMFEKYNIALADEFLAIFQSS